MSKTETQKLVEAFAIQKEARRHAPPKVQQRLYDKYNTLLNKTLTKHGIRFVSQEFLAELEAKADAWLGTQGIRGAGRWW